MRYLITLLFAALSFSAFSQNNAIHVYPWNPDANQDNEIGMGDLLSFLSVFGNEFGLPPEPCTYDGSPLEELMFGILDGSMILDSIFMEYELEDITTYYPIGCPDQVTDTLIFNNTVLLTNFYVEGNSWTIGGYDNIGLNELRFHNEPQLGTYSFELYSVILGDLGFIDDGFFASYYSQTESYPIPFPEDWYLDENGIHIESDWDPNNHWAYYANYLHILPYWHYADE